GNAALKEMWQSLVAMLRLLRAYASGEYRNVPAKSLVLIVAGILYFVLPIDVIPDFLVGVGFLDDAAVLAWVFNTVRTVLDDFAGWEASRPSSMTDRRS
ncbi:MAG: YkvA family protein, partial [Vicinamibacterales bacterium]